MSGLTFNYEHRVTYADCTLGNHIYYSRYLDLLEAARGAFFRHLGTPFLAWQQQDTLFPVRESHLRYLAPARYDDLVTVVVWVTLLQGARLHFGYQIVEATGRAFLEAETWHACTGLNERPKRLPEPLRLALQPYLHPNSPGDLA